MSAEQQKRSFLFLVWKTNLLKNNDTPSIAGMLFTVHEKNFSLQKNRFTTVQSVLCRMQLSRCILSDAAFIPDTCQRTTVHYSLTNIKMRASCFCLVWCGCKQTWPNALWLAALENITMLGGGLSIIFFYEWNFFANYIGNIRLGKLWWLPRRWDT